MSPLDSDIAQPAIRLLISVNNAHNMRIMNSRDVIAMLEAAGWQLKRVTGSHHHFMNPDRPGIATVPHPKKDLPIGTVRSIEKQTGLKLR